MKIKMYKSDWILKYLSLECLMLLYWFYSFPQTGEHVTPAKFLLINFRSSQIQQCSTEYFQSKIGIHGTYFIFKLLFWVKLWQNKEDITRYEDMSHFSYPCKMRCPLNLVLQNCKYLWFYLTFWIAILDCGLKLHKLSIHTLVMLEKGLEIH